MKRRTKVIIIITATILVCGTLGVWCINKFVIPVTVKGLIINFLKEKTGRNVTVENINYLPLTRLYLKGIALYDTGTPGNPLVNIEGLSFRFQIWPLLKDKSIIASLGLKNLTYGTTNLSGAAYLSLKRRAHPAERPFFKDMDGVVRLTNFSFATSALPSNIEDITGAVSLYDNTLRLDKTYFKYNNVVYNIEGDLTDLDEDESGASVALNSNILKSDGEFTVRDDYIQIKKIDGTLLGSSFNIIGDIKELSSPLLNLYCEAKTDLADLKKLFPGSKYISDSLNPAGLCNAAIFFNGRLGKLKTSEASMKLTSSKVFLHGLALDNLYSDLRMKDGEVSTYRFELRPYLGFLNGSFALDLNKKDLPYSLSFVLKDGNLARFSADMNFGKENLSGLISSKFLLKGSLNSINTLRGSGWITVTNGHLWKVPLLGGVTEFMGLPHLRSEVFKEAAGNFIVDQRRISTEDLTFYSDKINMNAAGFIDFDGNIDVLLQTLITEDLVNVEGASDAAKIANLIISQAGNYLGRIRITGTLKKPKYGFAVKPIEEIFKKDIKGLLRDILQ